MIDKAKQAATTTQVAVEVRLIGDDVLVFVRGVGVLWYTPGKKTKRQSIRQTVFGKLQELQPLQRQGCEVFLLIRFTEFEQQRYITVGIHASAIDDALHVGGSYINDVIGRNDIL